jgi:hypothetical protein
MIQQDLSKYIQHSINNIYINYNMENIDYVCVDKNVGTLININKNNVANFVDYKTKCNNHNGLIIDYKEWINPLYYTCENLKTGQKYFSYTDCDTAVILNNNNIILVKKSNNKQNNSYKYRSIMYIVISWLIIIIVCYLILLFIRY